MTSHLETLAKKAGISQKELFSGKYGNDYFSILQSVIGVLNKQENEKQ